MRYLLIISLLMFPLFAPAFAASCDSLFVNVVGTTKDTLELKDRAQLFNTGNRRLATDRLTVKGSASCDGRACQATGSDLTAIEIAKHDVRTDLKKQSRSFTPGDYYFDDVELKDNNRITINGTGQVRIHIRDDLHIKDNARINVGGAANSLVFIVYDDFELKGSAQMNALVYVRDKVQIKDRAQMTGAVVGKRVSVKDSARVRFQGAEGSAVNGLCTGGGGGPSEIPIGVLNFRVEVGELNVINTYQKPEFTRVNFTQEFHQPPVVFTLPTTDGSNPAAHRIRNITVDGFDIMTLEPYGEDGAHVSMRLNYLALETGTHTLPNGKKMRVGVINTRKTQAYGGGTGWENISFDAGFSQVPAVLAQIQTMVNEQERALPTKPSRPWLTTAIHDVTANGMKLALERSESLTGSVNANETVAYLAMEPYPLQGFMDSRENTIYLEALRSEPTVKGWGTCNSSATRVYFNHHWDKTPIALATKNTRDGDSGRGDGDGGWLRRCRTTQDYVGLAVDEVRSTKQGDRDRVHHTAERVGLVLFSDNFVLQARQLDHFRLIHDGVGSVGKAEDVTIKVCRNADCSQLYEGTVTVTLSPGNSQTSWSGDGVLANQVTFSGGSKTVKLNQSAPGQITMSVDTTPRAENPLQCHVGDKLSCKMTFAASDFDVDLPDQVSALVSSGSVSLGNCFEAFQSKQVQLSASVSYLNPATAGPAVTANGASLPTDGSSANVPLQFNDSCLAPLSLSYTEVGQLNITLQYIGSGDTEGMTISGADSLVFYPNALRIRAEDAGGSVLNGSHPGASTVHPAGAPFNLSIEALNASNAVTRRYQPQGTDTVRAYVRRVGPLGGGTFDGRAHLSPLASIDSNVNAAASAADFVSLQLNASSFVNGAYTHTAASFGEVGVIGVDAMDSDYLGHSIEADEVLIGRFVPASLAATATLLSRADTSGCAGDSFNYMGENMAMTVDLSALNTAGGVTRNYAGSYAKLNTGMIAPYAGNVGQNTLAAQSGTTDLSTRLGIQNLSLSSWLSGAARLNADLTINRLANADGPLDDVHMLLALTDTDGVKLQPLDRDLNQDGSDDHDSLGVSRWVYGRVVIGNNHGAELADLNLPVSVQYYAGATQGFLTHTQDNCSPITSVALSDADASDSLQLGESCIWDSDAESGAFACSDAGEASDQYLSRPQNGDYRLILVAPGQGNIGSLDVTLTVPDWLKYHWLASDPLNPSATATFGIYNQDTRIIYQRQVQ